MQSIKQFRVFMTYLYTCLYDKFEALRDEHLTEGCTCPQGSKPNRQSHEKKRKTGWIEKNRNMGK